MTSQPTSRATSRNVSTLLVGVVIGFVAALGFISLAVLLNLDTIHDLILMWFVLSQR